MTRTQLVALCLLAGIASASTVTRTVRSTGQAVVVAGDIATARDQARRAALREAVESGVGVLISSTTRASNYAIIEDEIFGATRGYVRSFDIVEQGASADGLMYEITVDAQVDLHQLEKQLASIDLAHAMAGRPRFLCRGAFLEDAGWRWSPELTGLLHQALAPLGERLEPAAAAEGSLTMDDGTLARTYMADILIDARAEFSHGDAPIPGTERRLTNLGIVSSRASITLEVRWLDQSNPVRRWTIVGKGAATQGREADRVALTEAVTNAQDSLRVILVEDLRRRAYADRTIQVQFEGGQQELDAVESLWAAAGFAGSLRPHSRDEALARYELDLSGSAFDLARAVSSHGVGRFDVQLLQVSANRIRLRLHEPAAQTAVQP
ncbi:MAG: hypothetical protein VX948_19145 [Candidatus Latescibacterota bacterium]|nr:hypothetical protein [Candidatus Latescibacterota bacterium]